MQSISGIGPSIKITGTVTSQEPLTIAGQVTGDVNVPGQVLTLAPTAQVEGDLTAETIVVSGKARGHLQASSRITVHETAMIDGKLTTPALSVAIGASIQGDVDVEGRRPSAALRLAS